MADPVLTDIPMERFLLLIDMLADDLAQDAWQPDFIVGVGRGGLAPATWLSHRTGVPMLSVDLSAGVAAFGEDLLALLAERTAGGERLLFVDDINDSGRTIAGLRRALLKAGADNARFAVLIDNVTSTMQVDYRGEWIDRTVTRDWFVFPWEARPF
ncbi:phosphoribosyltransferase family protein [Sphingobium sp. AN558]|uniref:phosphoribosyltransferase n=1 Tax=Sphingobium sp. AN558 TaxID=3133442 RepID=UPI0030BF4BE0